MTTRKLLIQVRKAIGYLSGLASVSEIDKPTILRDIIPALRELHNRILHQEESK